MKPGARRGCVYAISIYENAERTRLERWIRAMATCSQAEYLPLGGTNLLLGTLMNTKECAKHRLDLDVGLSQFDSA